jgi:hypothetical protein
VIAVLQHRKVVEPKADTDDPIISDPNRRGVWIDQGDGTSLRAEPSAIADGFTSDVLSTSGMSWLRGR